MPLTPTDQGDLTVIPSRQIDFFLDWCIEMNMDPSSDEARQMYLQEVATWNAEHDLTGTCSNPECQQGMRDDGREVCSLACHYAINPKENQA